MIRLTPTRRPTGTLRLNRSNPLTAGLIDVFVAGETINLVSGLKLVDSGSGSYTRASNVGLSKLGNSGNFAYQSAAPAGLRVDEITLLALTAPQSPGSATTSVYGFGNSGDSTPLAFIGQSGTSGKVYFFVRSSAGVTQNPDATPSAAWANLVPNVLVGVRSQAGNFHSFYQNGNQIATTTATTLGATTLNTTSVNGLLRTSAGLSYAGDTAICLAWNRALSPAEIRRISDNPWQIFEGFTLYVKTAGGGAITGTADLSATYTVTGTASADASAAYGIRGAVQADASAAYNLRGAVQADASAAYAIGGAVTASLDAAYEILSADSVSADFAAAYVIQGTVQADASAAYALRGAVQVDGAGAYNIRTAAQADLSAAYDVEASTGITYTRAPRGTGHPARNVTSTRPGHQATTRPGTRGGYR